MDLYTIIFLVLAVFIFARLRSVLGSRTGRERPPVDPFSGRDSAPPAARDKVVTLPGAATQVPQRDETPAADRLAGIADPASPVGRGLAAVAQSDREFDPAHFLVGAKAAYEMIIGAFAAGDRRTLKNLLGREVYDDFDTAITEREKRRERMETRFVSIDKADIVAAELKGRIAQITVKFVSQLISVTRDSADAVIDGSPDRVTDVTDIWTFARETGSRDPNWKLVTTEAA